MTMAALVAACGPPAPKFNAIDITGANYAQELRLPDHTGKLRSLADFKGSVVTVFFGFTHCPDVCPTTLARMAEVMKGLGADAQKVQVLFVTVDPERDTPELLGSYVSGVSDRIIGISGSPEKIRDMTKGFNIYAKKVPVDASKPEGDYTMDHTASVFLLDAEGRFKGTIAWGENPDIATTKLGNLLKP